MSHSAKDKANDAFARRVERTRATEAFQRGDFRLAFRLGSDLLRRAPGDLALTEMTGLAAVQLEYGRHAERLLKRVVKRQPREARAQVALADAYLLQAKLDEARHGYDKALALDPGDRRAIAGKATVLEIRGAYDAAAELLRPLIETGTADARMVVIWTSIEHACKRFDTTIDLVMRHIASPRTPLVSRRRLCQLVARAFEKTERYDESFAALEASNRVIECPFDADAYVAGIDDLLATFSARNLAILPRAKDRSPRPVFIACMPRSGSTLCEQIIHAHPAAFGAGEITEIEELVTSLPQRLDSLQAYPACLGDWTQAHADDIGRWYLRSLDTYGGRADRVVNKHLDNDIHLGMIALICPGARVIHCSRDPVDNGLSVFMAAMNPEKYPWATDLESIGLVYRQHERLMRHWKGVLDLEFLDVSYEVLVHDADAGIRRIIDFCGLPWDDACLAFHQASRDVTTLSYEQVRQPIYRSAVGRKDKYAAHLEPLKRALEVSG